MDRYNQIYYIDYDSFNPLSLTLSKVSDNGTDNNIEYYRHNNQ